MRSSKERKHDKKRKQDTMSVKKTERSRTRRLANKAKRAKISAIDPDMKVTVIDQRIYDKHGTEIEIVNDKIVAAKLDDDVIKAIAEHYEVSQTLISNPVEESLTESIEVRKSNGKMDEPTSEEIIDNIKTRNKNVLQRLTDKFKGLKGVSNAK